MLLGMQLFVYLETCTELLHHRLREIGMGLAVSYGEKEPQTLAAQRFLLYNADHDIRLTEPLAASCSAPLELRGGAHVLVEEVGEGVEHGESLIGSGAEAKARLPDDVERSIGDVVAYQT